MHGRRRRRAVLRGLAALVAAGIGGVGDVLHAQQVPAPLFDPARLPNLSNALTGYAVRDRATAAALLKALRAAVGNDALRRIATLAAVVSPEQLNTELARAGLTAQAQTVIIALYTGVVDTPNGPQVVTYDDALIWQALPWTKPNMFCGGTTDYWSDPPAGIRS